MTSTPPPRRPLVATDALDLEDLLTEIRRRAAGASQAHERVAGLLDAVVGIGSDLELSRVLQRILVSACDLVEARYGALGVLDPSGQVLAEFHTHGLDAEARAAIGELPSGRGVLGHLIREPRMVRIEDLAEHPSAAGFPPNHPPMRTFIGAPLRVRDRVYGNLYLTERRGGEAFTPDDEIVLQGLAAAAGIAIDNAEMYRRARGREEWSGAMAELTQTLLEGRNESAALARMVRRVRGLAGARSALFAVRGDDAALHVEAADPPRRAAPPAVLRDDRWRLVLEHRAPLLVLSLPRTTDDTPLLRDLLDAVGPGGPDAGVDDELGCAAIVPLTVGAVEVGLIALAWDAADRARAARTMELLTDFAEQMALAVEAARAQRQRARSTLLEDRDRIARDMHDHVIQRLYAAGLSLRVTSRRLDDTAKGRLESVVDELDGAVKDLRRTIFELRRRLPEGGLGPEIETLVAQTGDTCGFVPNLAFEGLLSDVPPEVEQDVVAVVREGLSNVARHSGARAAQVRVSTVGDIVVAIEDDGIGIEPQASLRGLANLRDRAAAHGGVFSVSARHPTGTLLRWRVPRLG